jgi:hypothetical protein
MRRVAWQAEGICETIQEMGMILIGGILVVLIFGGAMAYAIYHDSGASDEPTDATPDTPPDVPGVPKN